MCTTFIEKIYLYIYIDIQTHTHRHRLRHPGHILHNKITFCERVCVCVRLFLCAPLFLIIALFQLETHIFQTPNSCSSLNLKNIREKELNAAFHHAFFIALPDDAILCLFQSLLLWSFPYKVKRHALLAVFGVSLATTKTPSAYAISRARKKNHPLPLSFEKSRMERHETSTKDTNPWQHIITHSIPYDFKNEYIQKQMEKNTHTKERKKCTRQSKFKSTILIQNEWARFFGNVTSDANNYLARSFH